MRDELLHASADPVEAAEEITLRPRRLDEFVGQPRLKEHLEIMLGAARGAGPGRRPRAVRRPARASARPRSSGIVADEMGVAAAPTSGPALERAGDLAAILTNLDDGDVLFIDEIHRLPRAGRGGALPGDGGLPARHRDRQGPDGAVDPPRPPALHARRRHDPHRSHHRPAARPLRLRRPPRLLRAPTTSSPSSSAPPASSACRSRPDGAERDRAPRPGHAPHRQPAAEARARLRRGARRRHRHHRDRAASRSSCSRSTSSVSTRSTARSSPRCARRSAGQPVGLQHAGGGGGRGARDGRGRLRAVPPQGRAAAAHTPRAHRHARRLRAPPPPSATRAAQSVHVDGRMNDAVRVVAAAAVASPSRSVAPRVGRGRSASRSRRSSSGRCSRSGAATAASTTTAPVDLAAARATVASCDVAAVAPTPGDPHHATGGRCDATQCVVFPDSAGGRHSPRYYLGPAGDHARRRQRPRSSSPAGLDGEARPHQGRSRRPGTAWPSSSSTSRWPSPTRASSCRRRRSSPTTRRSRRSTGPRCQRRLQAARKPRRWRLAARYANGR